MGLNLTIFSLIKEAKSESKKIYIFGIIKVCSIVWYNM